MDCKTCQEYLSDYIDGCIPENEVGKIEQHIERCSLCKKEYEEMKYAIDSLRSLPDIDPPMDFKDEVKRKIKSEIKNKNKRNLLLPLGAAAVIVLFFIFSGISGIFTPTGESSFETSSQNSNSEAMVADKVDVAEESISTKEKDMEFGIAARPEDKSEQKQQEGKNDEEEQGTLKMMSTPRSKDVDAVIPIKGNLSADIKVEELNRAVKYFEELLKKYEVKDLRIEFNANEATVSFTIPQEVFDEFMKSVSSNYKLINVNKDIKDGKKSATNVRLHLKNGI